MELYAAIRCLIENGYAVIEHLPDGRIALVTTRNADPRKQDGYPGMFHGAYREGKTVEGSVN